MIVLIFVFPVLIFIFFWKFTSVDGVLKPKKFCPPLGLNSRPRAQHSDVQSQELYHSAILAPLINHVKKILSSSAKVSFTLVHFTHQYLPTYDNMFHYLDMKYFCCLKRTSLLPNTHQRGRCSNEKLMVGRRAAVSSRLLMNVISPNIISHHF